MHPFDQCAPDAADCSARFFDASVLPASLGTEEPDILHTFYQMCLDLMDEVWPRLGPQQPVEVVCHLAHKLKSASESIGARALAESLRDLKRAAAADDSAAISERVALVGAVMITTANTVRKHMERLNPTPLAVTAAERAPDLRHLFDAAALTAYLETDQAGTLREFYLLFLKVTEEIWRDIAAAQDPQLVRRLAHKLKSSAASIGAPALAAALQELERIAEQGEPLAITESVWLVGALVTSTCEAVSQHVQTGLAQGPAS